MSILERASKPEREPLVATIVGSAGSGKTSLAATFPKPILIRTQGEALPRDLQKEQMPDSMPELNAAVEVWDILKALLNDEHDYKTLIIDSVTGLEQLFAQEVLASDPKARGINQALGGYGAGPAAVMASHMRVRKAVEFLRKRRGMHTIFVAHADIGRIDPPDSDGYNQYTLRLPGKSMAPYVDNTDLVGFLKQGSVLRGEDGNKKAISTGERVLVTYLTPASVAKNRFGIDDDIIVEKGINPLAFILGDEPSEDKPKRGRPRKEVRPTEEHEDEAADAVHDAAEEGVN